jgi:hypothetical protein
MWCGYHVNSDHNLSMLLHQSTLPLLKIQLPIKQQKHTTPLTSLPQSHSNQFFPSFHLQLFFLPFKSRMFSKSIVNSMDQYLVNFFYLLRHFTHGILFQLKPFFKLIFREDFALINLQRISEATSIINEIS